MKISGLIRKRERIEDIILDYEKVISRYRDGVRHKDEVGLDLNHIADNLTVSVANRRKQLQEIDRKIEHLKQSGL